MSSYSIPDLLELLRTARGERVNLDIGFPPRLVLKGETHEIEGPPVLEESMEEMLRAIASTREMRVFRESGVVDVIIPLNDTRFLVRAVRAFNEFRLELAPITT